METIITPLSVELRIGAQDIVYVLQVLRSCLRYTNGLSQVAPLNNAIDPQKSSTIVHQRTGKVFGSLVYAVVPMSAVSGGGQTK